MTRLSAMGKSQRIVYPLLLLAVGFIAVLAMTPALRAGKDDPSDMADNKSAPDMMADQLSQHSAITPGLLQTTNSFDSGSDGSDGPLIITGTGTIAFNPEDYGHAPGENIYHFTTITVGSNITLTLSAQQFNGPVHWLASGSVQIDGLIDLGGEDGQHGNVMPNPGRIPAWPGPGGFPGGVGHYNGNSPGQSGIGPGGGINSTDVGGFGTYYGRGAGHAVQGSSFYLYFPRANAYGNNFLVPLIGGSGGGGGYPQDYPHGGNGGAGGGALLIASSELIAINGTILTNGGKSGSSNSTGSNGRAGGGSGGSIHLLAPVINGNGNLEAKGIVSGGYHFESSYGRIRLDAFENYFTGTSNPTAYTGIPYQVHFPVDPPSVRVTSIAGFPVSDYPTADLNQPNITLDSDTPVTITVEAENVPPGYVVQLYIYSEAMQNQIVESTPLSGTLTLSTAIISATLPFGPSRMFARVDWVDFFRQHQQISVGSGPYDVALADFNQDNWLDMAVANHNSDDMTIRLGNGDGTFQQPVHYGAGNGPFAIDIADFNENGHYDLVVANWYANNVSIFWGNGDGTFQQQQTIAVGSNPSDIIAIDLNDDNHDDLIVTNRSSDNISVFLGNGDGTFQAEQNFNTGGGPYKMAIEYLDGDTFLDVVTVNYDGDNFSVLLGNGDGTFQPNQNHVMDDQPVAVSMSDVNGDTIMDVVVTSRGDPKVSLFLGIGDGTFQVQRIIVDFWSYANPSDVFITDLNHDTLLDLVLISKIDGYVLVLPGNGDGTFQTNKIWSALTGKGPFRADMGDLNGDGLLDLVTANVDNSTVSILLQQ